MAQEYKYKPYKSQVTFEIATERAKAILLQMKLEDKINLVGGFNKFFIKGYETYGIPELYLSDATQGVHIRKELSNLMEKSTAFPCPLALTATWNPALAFEYAKSIGEECRTGDVAVLLGPGVNIYRVSQNGRNFEYFGEDPFLASRMVESYITGVQSTGTIATLKHFLCNNNEYYRRTTNVIVDERTLHEIYLPAFKAGIDAGALAVMTSYNKVNGEWAGQNKYVISELLRKQLGFKGLVMTDWWSVWDPEKTIKSGQDLEMPGEAEKNNVHLEKAGDVYVRSNAMRLIQEGRVKEEDINRMAESIIRTCVMAGLYDRPVKDLSLLSNMPEHEKIALQTAREAIVLLRNDKILPVSSTKKIILTGQFVEKLARGLGSAEVQGYNNVSMLAAFKDEFGNNLNYLPKPTNTQLSEADIVILSVGTLNSEGWDQPFNRPEIDSLVLNTVKQNPNTVVIVNSGSGINMSAWNSKVKGILYAWYLGQNGNKALAEVISGKTNPSGKLPLTIEKSFEDSPGYGYCPINEKLPVGWEEDWNIWHPQNNVEYKEGVLVGYRWYETKNIKPLYPFGFGLSYTHFKYSELEINTVNIKNSEPVKLSFKLTNIGKVPGTEICQVYIRDVKSTVLRPQKELKGFKKVHINPGETQTIEIMLQPVDFSFWDTPKNQWKLEPGEFELCVGSSSESILLKKSIFIE